MTWDIPKMKKMYEKARRLENKMRRLCFFLDHTTAAWYSAEAQSGWLHDSGSNIYPAEHVRITNSSSGQTLN